MGRKCQIQTHRKNCHSKFSQTVTSKQWRSRKLSETDAGTSANNAGSNARTHTIQTICRQRSDEMDCPTRSVGSFLVSAVVRYSPHSIVPWADRTVENWWRLERTVLAHLPEVGKGIWKSSTKVGRQMETLCVAGKERPHRRTLCPNR